MADGRVNHELYLPAFSPRLLAKGIMGRLADSYHLLGFLCFAVAHNVDHCRFYVCNVKACYIK